jgi:hypothetical protein
MSLFARLEATTLANTIAQSVLLTGSLSAVHLVGFTLLMGAAVVSNLRLTGTLFPQRPVLEIAEPAARAIAMGLAISVASGLLLFSARASAAIVNSTFQLKMLLLLGAALFHFAVHLKVARQPASTPGLLRMIGTLGLVLWLGLALAGCAFILLE